MKANGRIYGDHIVVFALSRDILYLMTFCVWAQSMRDGVTI